MFKPYKSYSFKDKDPVIDRLRTIVQDSGESYRDIHHASGVSLACINGWFNGATRRPQHATLMAVARSLGYDYQLVRVADTKVVRLVRKKRA